MPYKFRLPDPILNQYRVLLSDALLSPYFVNVRKWFSAMFSTYNNSPFLPGVFGGDSNSSGFDSEFDGNDGSRHVNLGFCGWMDFSSGNSPLFNGPPE